MRLSIGKGIMILICICLLGGLVYVDSIDKVDENSIELSFLLEDEIVNAWKGEEGYYLFLPSYAALNDIKLSSYSTEFEITDKEVLVMRGGTLSELACEEWYECKTTASKERFSFYIMKSENLPTVYMETDSGSIEEIWSDKRLGENGKIQIYDENGTRVYHGGLKTIRGRGNYSFSNYEKKPFVFTMKEEVSLLGLGTGAIYSLLSNASDPTLIRNELARKMEAAVNAEYTNEGRFVDLYVNGDYLGNYYLCENPEIGQERIAVTELESKMDYLYQKSNYESMPVYETEKLRAKNMDYNPDDISGGYLVEREFADRYKLEYYENPSSFVTEGEEHFVVKSPVYCSDEQIRYLADYFNKAEKALLSKDGIHPDTGLAYTDYIDVESFVKKYLVEEITKNYDGGISSSFFYKDSDLVDGKIKAAPIWDCDMSLGNYLDWMEYFSADPKGVSRLALHVHASPWHEALYDKEEAYKLICEYYEKYAAPFLEGMENALIDEYKEYLDASASMNNIRWKKELNKNPYYSDWDDEFEELKNFVSARKAFLDEVWIEQIEYYVVTFELDGAISEIRYIKEGESLGSLPVVESERFEGWNYKNSTREIAETDPVTRDTVVVGKMRADEKVEIHQQQ